MKSVKSDISFRVVFSFVFWFFWLVLPILNSIIDGDEQRREKLITLLPLYLLAIPFFYLNAEFLAPRFLYKEKLPKYFLGLLLVFILYLISYVFVKDRLIDDFPIRVYDSRTLFPVLFVMGMSTLYGLIVFINVESRKKEEMRAERMQSELSFLRSQISPHFIFNILNSIVYLIRVNSPKAEKVTIELSKLIRYMLYETENRSVHLDKEIEYLENYVGLQKVRFEEDVDIQMDISGNASHLVIEPMLLIPFVENAFKHGVGLLKDPFINIGLHLINGNTLEFRVRNKCNENNDEPKDNDSGIGIKNVKRRIELLYPDSHELNLTVGNGIYDVYLKLILKTDPK